MPGSHTSLAGLVATAVAIGALPPIDRPLPARIVARADQRNPALTACLGPLTPAFPAYARYEPYAAVNPRDSRNIVAAWMTENATNRIVIQAAASFDGGDTWSEPEVLPFTSCAGAAGPVLDVATDPWVAFGPDGVAYVSAQAYAGPAGGHAALQDIAVTTSSDGGRRWSRPRAAMAFQGPAEQTDNTTITANPVRPGVAYVATTRITGRLAGGTGLAERGTGSAAFSRTGDGGSTWSTPHIISPQSPGAYADLPQILVDERHHSLAVVHSRSWDEGELSIQTSKDDGVTWSRPHEIAAYVGLRNRIKTPHPLTGERLAVAEDIVRAAIEPSTGMIAVVFADGRHTQGNRTQISLMTSADAGSTWNAPTRINSVENVAAWLPSPTWQKPNLLSVAYFDARASKDGNVNLWLARIAVDAGGKTTTRSERLVDRFPFLAHPAEKQYFLADYYPAMKLGAETGLVYVRTRCDTAEVPCIPGRDFDARRARTEVVFVRVPE